MCLVFEVANIIGVVPACIWLFRLCLCFLLTCLVPPVRRPKLFSRHPAVGCWTYRLWRPCRSEDPQKPPLNFRLFESRDFSVTYLNADPVRSMAFTTFFIRPSLMCRGGSRILYHSVSAGCYTFFYSSFRDFHWGQSLFRQCKAFARLSHSHKKNRNTSYIPVADPSTPPSGHHKYASHTCCIQAYSAAALGFRRFLSCRQRVRLEWMDVGFHYAATPPSDSISRSL